MQEGLHLLDHTMIDYIEGVPGFCSAIGSDRGAEYMRVVCVAVIAMGILIIITISS